MTNNEQPAIQRGPLDSDIAGARAPMSAPLSTYDDGDVTLLDFAIVLAKHKWKLIGIPFLAAVLAAGLFSSYAEYL